MTKKLTILALFLALPMLMLYPLWSNPVSAGEDDVIYYYPLRKMAFEQIRQGQWPLWNSREVTGVPLFADPQSGLLFPPNWLCAVLPIKLAYSLAIFLAFSTAGGGAYLYLRRIGLDRPAALFGGIAFMFCGFMVGHRVHLSLIQTAAFLPWGLLGIELLRGGTALQDVQSAGGLPARRTAPPLADRTCGPYPSNRWRGFWVLTGVVALSLAAGHWPTVIHMSLAWGVYFLFRARPFFKGLLTAAAAGVAGVLLVLPQVVATVSFVSQSVRSNTPYIVATENSFFPLHGVLAFFPLIMGCRNQNCVAWQNWWGGPWSHLCETLGYVGLVTLVLAGAAAWRLYRRSGGDLYSPRRKAAGSGALAPDNPASLAQEPPANAGGYTTVPPGLPVKLWVWLAVGAFVFMLGLYTGPLYKLIYMLPGLGKVRCPARMILLLDMALATLAAMGIHAMMAGAQAGKSVPTGETSADSPLARTMRRLAFIGVPVGMAVSLGLIGWVAVFGGQVASLLNAPFDSIRAALDPRSPAIWVWLLLAVVTAFVIRSFARTPGRRWGLLLALLLVDLFFITRFVDVPAPGRPNPDPEVSPAAQWLRENGGREPYRIWGLGKAYNDRPNELLLAKTSQSLGFDDINNYGPFQPVEHAMLFNMRPWGQTPEWPQLIRRNHLLSLFNVRYILAADPDMRAVLESVVIPESPLPPDGPEMLARWKRLEHATVCPVSVRSVDSEIGAVEPLSCETPEVVLDAPGILTPAVIEQPVTVQAGKIYRIRLECRAPGGLQNHVRAEVAAGQKTKSVWDSCGHIDLATDQLLPGGPWRHFEWTFQAEADAPAVFRIVSTGPGPVEFKNISLRPSSWETPTNFEGRLKAGHVVYVDRTPGGLPPVREGNEPVHIYENMLCLERQFRAERVPLSDRWAVVEALRWGDYDVSEVVLAEHDSAADSISPTTFSSERPQDCLEMPANALGKVVNGRISLAGDSGPAWMRQLSIWNRNPARCQIIVAAFGQGLTLATLLLVVLVRRRILRKQRPA